MTTRTLFSFLVLSSLAALPAAAAPEKVPTKSGSTEGVARTAPPQQLKPGEYFWHPEASPAGPLVMVVSIPDQRANVYRNGVIIGATTVSTGKKGHETPTGVFTILEKDVDHHSSIYNNAPMPYMERLTWSGVALHAGKLPGYPASHGCVRMPYEFAKLLFGETHKGITVVVSDESQFPSTVAHPGLFAPIDRPGSRSRSRCASATTSGSPRAPPRGRSRSSSAARTAGSGSSATASRSGARPSRSPIPGRQLMPHVFTLLERDAGRTRPRWMVRGRAADGRVVDGPASRGHPDPPRVRRQGDRRDGTPGTTMLVTPTTATGETTTPPRLHGDRLREGSPEAQDKKKG